MGIEKLNVYQKIHLVMTNLTTILKGDKTVNGQYKFVSHDAVTKECHAEFVKARLICVPTVKSYTQDDTRTEVVCEVSIINIDQPEERVTVESFGYGIDKGDKGPGKAISYATKYALLKLLLLETLEDPDNDANSVHKGSKTRKSVNTKRPSFQNNIKPDFNDPF